MDQSAILKLALLGLTVREDCYFASIIGGTSHVATTTPAKSVDEENDAVQDDDDDVKGITVKALPYAVIKSPTSAMD